MCLLNIASTARMGDIFLIEQFNSFKQPFRPEVHVMVVGQNDCIKTHALEGLDIARRGLEMIASDFDLPGYGRATIAQQTFKITHDYVPLPEDGSDMREN